MPVVVKREAARRDLVEQFANHLIFYQPRSDGVSIVRVLHAARDWWEVLGMSE